MKKYTNIYAMVAILMLLFASCSTETVEAPIDDTKSESVDLTFGALLNDLANRSMNKNHFAQVPDCSEAEPAFAVIGLSVDGVVQPDVTVAILSDSNGYFTAYSEALKILVPSGGSVTITLNSFMVYDGDPTLDGSEIIWIAPIESIEGEFDGYVAKPLPFDFELEAGTKPYIDIEVLCFDRRMVNEYGYVFFDILPKTIYPLCLFVNYCNEDDRHWVADYSIDLYFGTNANGIQLYSNSNPNAMAATGTTGATEVTEGEFYADPLCLVIPGPPANLDNDDPYLYLVIYPQDWTDSYGDIINTPVPVQLSWNMVNALLNDDGTTNEYLHLLVGECDDARDGDPTIPGGGNGNAGDDCDTDSKGDSCDPDEDGLTNAEEKALGTDPDDPDTDGDTRNDKEDKCPLIGKELDQVETDRLGCWKDPDTGGEDCDTTITCDIGIEPDSANNQGCQFSFINGNANGDEFVLVNDGDVLDLQLAIGNVQVGQLSTGFDGEGDLVVTIDNNFDSEFISKYEIEVHPADDGGAMITTCQDMACDLNLTADTVSIDVELVNDVVTGYPFYIRIKSTACFNL